MRLWDSRLLKYLPQKQLSGQWKEGVQMLYGFWGKKHSTVDWAWKYGKFQLALYMFQVYLEMKRRGYNPKGDYYLPPLNYDQYEYIPYLEFNDSYLAECLENLKRKGVNIHYA